MQRYLRGRGSSSPPSRPGWPSKVVTPASQPVEHARVGLQPVRPRPSAPSAPSTDGAHDLVLHRQREVEVAEQLADVRAFGDVAGADIGVDRGAAEVRAELVAAARGRPARSCRSSGAAPSRGTTIDSLCFVAFSTWASMPCSLDSTSSKPLRPNWPVVDHVQDHAVAVVAGLDAVDLAVELVLELGDVGEVLEARAAT